MVGRPSPKDLVICLLSGGASALMPMPLEGLGVRDMRETTRHLLRSGASIREVNIVRKHLSGLKGGRLAQRLYPATILSLIISDVVADDVGSIASGPTSPDESTFADARRVLERYDLKNRVPPNVWRIIERGTEGAVTDTPKPGSKIFKRVHNLVVGNNRDCCEAAANSLRKQGYRTIILSTKLEGEARQVGLVLARILLDLDSTRFSFARPLAIVAGGETTVTVKGPGLGGRNQELVLSAALEIQGLESVALGSMDTDGIDGSTPVAGAIADGNTIKQGLRRGLDGRASLERNDSYNFFRKLKGLIITGRTGSNVNDLVVAVANSRYRGHHSARPYPNLNG
jgi:glycerate-2-kinase